MTSKVIDDMELPPKTEFRVVRCTRCGRMLCLEAMTDGALQIKCPRCKNITVLAVRPEQENGSG